MIVQTVWHHLSKVSSFRGHVALTVVTNSILLGMAILSGGLAARLLGPHGRGELAAIQSWSIVLTTLGALGLPQAITYFTGCQAERSGTILITAMTVLLVFSLPIICVGYLLMPWLLQAQLLNVVQEARLYLLLIPVQFIAVSFYTLQGRSDFVAWNALRLAAPSLWIGVLLLAFVTERRTPAFVARSYLLALALLALTTTYWITTHRTSGRRMPSVKLLGQMLRFGVPVTLTLTPQLLGARLDQLMMAALLPAEVLGLYAVAASWGSCSWPVLTAVASVVFPKVASLDSDIAKATFARTVRLSIVLAIPLGILLASITPVAIPLVFGIHFLPSVPAALILVASGVVQGLNQIIEGGLQGLGLPRMSAIAESTGLGLSAALLTLLLPRYQLIGAAVISLISSSATLLLLLWGARHKAGCPARTLLLVRREDLVRALALTGNLLAR